MGGVSRIGALVAGLLAASLATATAQPTQPYKVVVVASYTGVSMAPYLPAAQGFEAFVDYRNRHGGIHGQPIDLTILDDHSTTSVGGAMFQNALSSAPVAVVHLGLSTILTQAKAAIADAPTAILTISADDSLLYPTALSNVFMLNASARQQSKAWIGQAQRMLGDLRGKKVALALAQTAYFDSMVTAISQIAAERGFIVAAVERFNIGIPAFASQATRIARIQPDVVLVAAIAGDVAVIVNAIADAGVTSAPIIGFSAISSDDVFQKLNRPNYLAFRPFRLGSEVSGLAAKIDSRYAGGMAGSNWTAGWGAGEVLADALDMCGDGCTGDQMIKSLQTYGPSHAADDVFYGPVVFTKASHTGLTAVQMYRLEGGKVVATGDPIDVGE